MQFTTWLTFAASLVWTASAGRFFLLAGSHCPLSPVCGSPYTFIGCENPTTGFIFVEETLTKAKSLYANAYWVAGQPGYPHPLLNDAYPMAFASSNHLMAISFYLYIPRTVRITVEAGIMQGPVLGLGGAVGTDMPTTFTCSPAVGYKLKIIDNGLYAAGSSVAITAAYGIGPYVSTTMGIYVTYDNYEFRPSDLPTNFIGKDALFPSSRFTCPPGKYNPSDSSLDGFWEAQCEDCNTTLCNPFDYVSSSCGGVSNRVCTPCFNCEPNEYMTGCTFPGPPVCELCICPSGQYIDVPCGDFAPSHLECEYCASTCGAGKYIPPGTSCDNTATFDTFADACANCTICPPGQYNNNTACSGLGIEDTVVCDDCAKVAPHNQYRSGACGGNTPAKQIDPGTYNDCKTCGGGEYILSPCDSTNPPDGSAVSDPKVCQSCKSCGFGEHVVNSCTGVEFRDNSTCMDCDTACQPGQFITTVCENGIPIQCQNCTTCVDEGYEEGTFPFRPCIGDTTTNTVYDFGCARCTKHGLVTAPINEKK